MERLVGALQEGRRPQAGRPSPGGSVPLPEGGAGRAPTDREEEVEDLALGSVFSLEGIAHKAIPTKGRRKRPIYPFIPIRIANAILGRAPIGRDSQPVEVEDLARIWLGLPEEGGGLGGPQPEGPTTSSSEPASKLAPPRSLLLAEDRSIFYREHEPGAWPDGPRNRRSETSPSPGRGLGLLLSGRRHKFNLRTETLGLRAIEDWSHQQIGQRSEDRCFETRTGSARSKYPLPSEGDRRQAAPFPV